MVYLTPDVPRWVPRDEAALADAAHSGLLVESHYFDPKESIPSGSGKNRELARDLASFAVDGGVLLVGVAESEDGPPELAPVQLTGLPERVEQVARSIPDPPIPVTCTAIPTTNQPGYGYLLIEVPATGTAPHMVDGRYMGRGDKTKTQLSDPEVLRLHQARAHTQGEIAKLVDAYVARDPIPPEVSAQAHGFVLAAPVRPRPEMLLNVRPDGRWQQLLHQLLDQGAHTVGTLLAKESQYRPSLRSVSEFSRRSDGAALTYGLSSAREPMVWGAGQPSIEDVVELEVTEDGAIRVLTTRLGDGIEGRGQVVFEDILPDLVRRTVSMASYVSDLTGYLGPWMFGVAATNIAGKPASGSARINLSTIGRFGTDQPEYRRYTEASRVEVQQSPGAVTERLVGRFLRSVGFENAPSIRPLLEDPIPDLGSERIGL
ncbi:helix-turn-helix domain-containing protein [Nocardioides ferulae]|uniref:AlbA family DNA-binding domain-containing protein n=1 Tax=Nocardioides ferulae TaxID=2340821 RepID=UPI000EB1A424|nr:hypothetical protein [Nocardioides ferulae]